MKTINIYPCALCAKEGKEVYPYTDMYIDTQCPNHLSDKNISVNRPYTNSIIETIENWNKKNPIEAQPLKKCCGHEPRLSCQLSPYPSNEWIFAYRCDHCHNATPLCSNENAELAILAARREWQKLKHHEHTHT